MTYHEAKATCESLISKLAEPLDLTETEFIYGAAGAQHWIGVNDIQEENEYVILFSLIKDFFKIMMSVFFVSKFDFWFSDGDIQVMRQW